MASRVGQREHEVIEETVVAWNGSAPARAALAWAIRHTKGLPLHLVRIADRSVSSAEYFVADSAAAAARITLMEDAERIRASTPGLRVTSELVEGDPLTELQRLSNARTLVVVGTERRSGSTMRFEWSVGVQLAAKAAGPVAVIPEQAEQTTNGVIVGVDGTAASRAAMDFAIGHARREGSFIRLIHAWSLPPLGEAETVAGDEPYVRSLEDKHLTILDEALSYVAQSASDLDVKSSLIRGSAHSALLDAAGRAQLLVVGNRGEGTVRRIILGSVSHAVLLNIKGPTVVVRSLGER
jgi:nucleotide-binding universal stress UspA family protein